MKTRYAALLPVLLLFPSAAFAYVDPGILSALYQLGYMAFFAVLSLIIFRPWAFIKATWRKVFPSEAMTDSGRENAGKHNEEFH